MMKIYQIFFSKIDTSTPSESRNQESAPGPSARSQRSRMRANGTQIIFICE